MNSTETRESASIPESKLLDELKLKEGFSSDAKLAASLGVTRGFICSIRKGRKRLSLDLATSVFSRLGRTFSVEDLESLLLPISVRKHTTNLRAVRQYVIERSKGRCQLCEHGAPFRTPDGQPYLEIHHVIPTEEGGEDSPVNLVALCPNCHRKMQFAPSFEDFSKLKKLRTKWRDAI